uniref:AAA+ ATPase domain-containing protein n=1 Tax=Kalanchoe fedtschenkoi TaxID=63787 RepID=A0A7N0U6V7_KALFE
MFVILLLKILVLTAVAVLTVKLIVKTAIAFVLVKGMRAVADSFYAHQTYRVPKFNDNLRENELHRKIRVYIESLPAVEDSDSAKLLTGSKPNEISVQLDVNQTVTDSFLGSRLTWTSSPDALILRIRRSDRRRVLRPYLHHIHTIADEIDQRRKELRLFINCGAEGTERESDSGLWRSLPFTHPATMETLSMDGDVKNRVKADLDQFVKSKQYYHRLGRVWKRSYLLYGPSGTGKSSFVAAMAKLLGFDVYDVDLTRIADDADLKLLIAQTANKSIVLVEDLDRFLTSKTTTKLSLTGLLNFMDGLASSCGEEKVMVFTVNSKDAIDPAVLRPGRIDVHIHFPLCDFSSFKTLASSHLGVKEHKLFNQVEEMLQSGASLSPAEIGELMMSNRSSPTRALKSVISALQTNAGERGRVGGHKRQASGSDLAGEPESVICRESVHTVREFRKLYGLLRMRSRKEDPHSSDFGSVDKSLS